jgi:alkaline phosphatase D
VVAQPSLVCPIDMNPGAAGTQVWNDPWSGYPAARQRLLEGLSRASNPVVLSGDMHGTYISDLRRDEDGRAVAPEFCGTSITTGGMASAADSAGLLAANPQLTFVNGHQRGYLAFEITPERLTTRVRAVDTSSRQGAVETVAEFTVDDGVPSAIQSG